MTLEKEMIRLFDADGTAEKIANNRIRKYRCLSRSQSNQKQINPKWHLVTLKNNEQKRRREKVGSNVKLKKRVWTRFTNTSLCMNVSTFYGRTIFSLLCFTFSTR